MVGIISQKADNKSEVVPAGICPGHDAIIGTRIPPSLREALPQPASLLNGLALSKKGESLPPLNVGPLSLVKMITVLS